MEEFFSRIDKEVEGGMVTRMGKNWKIKKADEINRINRMEKISGKSCYPVHPVNPVKVPKFEASLVT